MLTIYIFVFFLAQNVDSTALNHSRPARQSRPTPTLIQGDIAVAEEDHHGTGEELSAFLSKPSALWPQGSIYFRIEEDEWEGVVEPIFTVEQVKNISEAHKRIMEAVPCIKFKYINHQTL